MNRNQLRQLIREVLSDMGLSSREAIELLMGTAAVESALGHYWYQVGGPAVGVFQMEPATEQDIWENFLQFKPELHKQVIQAVGISGSDREELQFNLKYQIIMARIHYYRVKEPLPSVNDIEGQAKYWKNHYNTRLGKGTHAKYIAAHHKFIKGA